MQPNLGNRRLSICGWKKSGSDKSKLMPWDLIDRMVGPIICCHAAAILLSGALNLLRISQVSALVLFILFTILTVSGVLFYHSLTVSVRTTCSNKYNFSPPARGGRARVSACPSMRLGG
uniref:Uncharacterized protein n=1 Tax=Anopheles melas TaxID=34690 RepID=A0A182TDH1_9DIPT